MIKHWKCIIKVRKSKQINASEYKHILKYHKDILTVSQIINKLYEEYKNQGHEMMRKVMNSFTYRLSDMTVIIVYWYKGIVYEEIVELPINVISKK